VSALVDRALREAGLAEIDTARYLGDHAEVRAATARLERADLLALGALADRVRKREVGDVVRVHLRAESEPPPPSLEGSPTGLAFLRAVAIARITGPRAACVRVDWTQVGIELAQVALGFGANALTGVVSNKRGLPIAESETSGTGKRSERVSARLAKKRELAALVERSGRRALFVNEANEEEEALHP
jgi:2-iminoacetate synthase ThiH